MSFTQTPNLHLYKPTINSDNDQWGTHLNSNADTLDAAVPAPSGTTPNMDGSAAPGSATAYARGDHTHPTDSTRAPLASPTFTGSPNLPTGTVAVTQTAGNSTTAPATTAFVQTAVAPALNNTGRNLLDNAVMNIAQHGYGPFTTPWVCTADRWATSGNTVSPVTSMSTTIITTPPADAVIIGVEMVWNEVQMVFTGSATAGAACMLYQGVEDPARMSSRTVIVSFYARCATGTLKLGVNLEQFFGPTGSGATPPVIINGQSVTITTTLARYSMTFTLPSVTSPSIVWKPGNCTYLQFWLSADATQNAQSGSVGVQSGTIVMTGIQCEFAQSGQTQPTPLEVLCYADDLARCQRYFQVIPFLMGGYSVGAGINQWGTATFSVQMRVGPSITFSSTSQSNSSGFTVNTSSFDSVSVNLNATATGVAWAQANMQASAELS